MNALWQIILRVLWRLRPVSALEVNIGDVIEIGLAMFQDDDEIAYLFDHPDHCAHLAAALGDAHRKLDLLVYLRACELAGQRSRASAFAPNLNYTHASATPEALWRSLARLITRFNAYESAAARRALRLRREAEENPLCLETSLYGTSQKPCAIIAVCASSLCPLIGDALTRASAQTKGGVPAFARGPPLNHVHCQKIRKSNLAVACENAQTWALHAQRSGHCLAVPFQHNNHIAAVGQCFDPEIRFRTAVSDDFTKCLLGFSPVLEALPPIQIGHIQSPFSLSNSGGEHTPPLNPSSGPPIR